MGDLLKKFVSIVTFDERNTIVVNKK